jgi:hypothetical protein
VGGWGGLAWALAERATQVPDLRLLCRMGSRFTFNPREVADLSGMVERGRQQLPKFYLKYKKDDTVCTAFFRFCLPLPLR